MMMAPLEIPATQRKLREAAYFIQKLHEHAAVHFGMGSEEPLYLLSAFLSAGRSVTLVLQVEQKDAYDAWFPRWKEGLNDDQLALFVAMNEQRVSEVHLTGAQAQAQVQYVPATELRNDNRRTHVTWWGPPGVPAPRIGKVTHHFDFGDGPERVVDVCERYYDLLERLVREFRLAHADTSRADS